MTEPTYLFLDTEWADVRGSELVSLALVGTDARIRFYAERSPLPMPATDFVSASVYPLLDRGDAALPDEAFCHKLNQFLSSLPNPRVLFDHPNDGKLLHTALAGFGAATHEAKSPSVDLMLLNDSLVSLLLEDWFAANPDAAVRRHHALVDAEALRMAWMAAHRHLEPTWSLSWSQLRDKDSG